MHKTSWLVLLFRVPAQPSRHRVAIWRELRRAGAVQLTPGSWTLPNQPTAMPTIDRVRAIVESAEGGELTVLEADGHTDTDTARLEQLFLTARQAEWEEFVRDSDKLLAEIEHEIAKQKLTLAELEEEEQSLERLRRWHRELKLRDIVGAPAAATADSRLAACETAIADFERRVFEAIGHSL